MKKYRFFVTVAALILALGCLSAAQAAVIPPEGPGQQIGYTAVVLCESLALRAQPNSTSEAIQYLKYGDRPIVIGADTVVILDGQVLGKPKDEDDAFQMLRAMSGKAHTVITGCAIIHNGRMTTFADHTRVEFYPLSDREILDYIATGEPFDKAGAYGIQGRGCVLVKRIEGDFFNVMGLPVARLKREMEREGALPKL